jgi:hypothetical protein
MHGGYASERTRCETSCWSLWLCCDELRFAPSRSTPSSISGKEVPHWYYHCLEKTKGKEIAGFTTTNGSECSHLCHYPPCVNGDHIVLEPGDVNKSRGCCLMYGRRHGYRCPHHPACFNCVPLGQRWINLFKLCVILLFIFTYWKPLQPDKGNLHDYK